MTVIMRFSPLLHDAILKNLNYEFNVIIEKNNYIVQFGANFCVG